jgi:hypothetical protein
VICERAQAIVSAAMDGDHVSGRHVEAAEAHVALCGDCRRFARSAVRARTAVRIRSAESVPDLVEPIMASVARERMPLASPRHARSAASKAPSGRWASVVAAAIAGLLVGSVVVGGPWQRPVNRPIAAAAVARGIRAEARTLDSLQATFSIHETGLAPDVPERTLRMDVAFLAPQRFRLDVEDLTSYPSGSWTPTDLTSIQNLAAAYLSGPSGCPGDLGPAVCPPTRSTTTRVSSFSASAPLPGDLVLPLATFGSTRGLHVVGQEPIDGHDAVRVELSFGRATPLFPFLRMGGTWRPFYDGDRVVLWLDAGTWFPLRYEVFASSDPARRAWEMRFGLASESSEAPILDVRAESMSYEAPVASLFRIPGGSTPASWPLAELPDHVGYLPATPTAPGSLQLASALAPSVSAKATPRSVLVYSDGLDYLRLGERPDWTGPGPFGPLDASAQRVAVPGGGVAFYEPAGEGLGRRLAIHASGTNVYLETNLTRSRLLAIAASIPLRGRALPSGWRVESTPGLTVRHTDPGAAAAAVGLTLPLGVLPQGYVVTSAEIASAQGALVGVTFHLRQRDSDAAGAPLSMHVEPGSTLPPASGSDQLEVSIGSLAARWTAGSSLLEWNEGGTYRSLQGPVDVGVLIAVAAAISGEGST